VLTRIRAARADGEAGSQKRGHRRPSMPLSADGPPALARVGSGRALSAPTPATATTSEAQVSATGRSVTADACMPASAATKATNTTEAAASGAAPVTGERACSLPEMPSSVAIGPGPTAAAQRIPRAEAATAAPATAPVAGTMAHTESAAAAAAPASSSSLSPDAGAGGHAAPAGTAAAPPSSAAAGPGTAAGQEAAGAVDPSNRAGAASAVLAVAGPAPGAEPRPGGLMTTPAVAAASVTPASATANGTVAAGRGDEAAAESSPTG
jgi:hypothetical protein